MTKTFKKLLLAGILLSVSGFVFAGDGTGSSRTFELRRHEIAVGGSFYPGHGMIFFGWDDDTAELSYDNAWWVSYTYNFTKLLAVGFSVTYDGFTSQSYIPPSDPSPKKHEYYITPMLTARFSWLNRPIVRLYSSAGVGLAIDSVGWWKINRNDKAVQRRCRFGWQATPIGISIGKKLYGYAELGVGSIYIIGCAGIGYRF